MRLHGMVRAFQNLLETNENTKLTVDEAISYLIDSEWDDKHTRKLERLIRAANFRYQATMEDLEFSPQRGLDKNLITRLSDCSWVKAGKDIIITGATGVGKSYIGSALGFQACRYGISVGYYSSNRLFNELTLRKKEGTYLKMLQRIMKKEVIILDDFGLEKMGSVSRMALLEIMEDRHKRKPIIIVSQMPVSTWHDIIGEPTIADAILDRLVYNSYRIELKGESFRKKNRIED